MQSGKLQAAGVVVAYHPDEAFYENLPAIAESVGHLRVHDNGGLDHERLSKLPVEIGGDGHNRGIAAALNQACDWARSLGYEWIVTLDQDSRPALGMWETMFAAATQRFPLERLGVISPVYVSDGKAAPLSFRKGFRRADARNGADCGRVWITMTSGNLVNLAAHRRVGGFNEDYFIDQVDHEFCLRLNAQDFVVCEVAGAELVHQVGATLSLHKFGRIWRVSQHSDRRVRYQSRNLSYLIVAQIHTSPLTVSKLAAEFVLRVFRLSCLLSQQQRTQLLVNAARGFTDALRHRTGALPSPPENS